MKRNKIVAAELRTILPYLSYVAIGLFILAVTTAGQITSSTDSTTPAGLTPGNPAGVYSLTDFENINLFNGNLNFTLPLLKVGGRGDAQMPVIFSLDTAHWKVDKDHVSCTREGAPPCPGGSRGSESCYRIIVNQSCEGAGDYYSSNPWKEGSEWENSRRYSPGILTGRKSGVGPVNSPYYSKTLTVLTFTTADGTEYNLRDQISNGEPKPAVATGPGFNRGTVFVSTNGEAATFISDSEIRDFDREGRFSSALPLSGVMWTAQGLRYRIVDGRVYSIRDRQGNELLYTYDGDGRIGTITDSLNRMVTFTYAASTDTITYKGSGGATRAITIHWTRMGNVLRAGAGYTIRHFDQLFTAGQGFNGNSPDDYNPMVASEITLPDNRSYKFFYNPYGELARVEVPTGGAIEYDYTTPTDSVIDQGSVQIHRRVTERRIYPNGSTGNAYDNRQIYAPVYSSNSPWKTTVTVEQKDANGNLLSKDKHYFEGSPIRSLYSQFIRSKVYPGWLEGKEIKTESYETNDTLIKTTENFYQQRAAVSWWSDWRNTHPGLSATADEPNSDPRLVRVETTLNETGQKTKQEFAYDDFNNQTEVKEYDYGNNTFGPLVRRTVTGYVTATTTINGFDYTCAVCSNQPTIHLRRLPLQTTVYDANNNIAALTVNEYDNYTPDERHAALAPRPSITGLCLNRNYPDGTCTTASTIDYLSRGNLTGATAYANAAAQTGAITVSTEYDIAGSAVKTFDGKGNSSTTDYADRFGAPDGEARGSTSPTELGSLSTYAFPTSGTNALGWTVGYTQFDYYTGQAVNAEDINGAISKTVYNDALDRATQSVTAIGTLFERQSNIVYDDINRRVETKSDLNALNDNLLKSESFYDGLGRTVKTKKYEADGGCILTESIPFVVVQDAETGIRRAATKASNPYRPLQNEQPVWTTALSDKLGRAIKTITPDNAVVKTEYSGNAVTVTDQAGKKRRSMTNALGQLTRVDEPDNNGNLGAISSPVQATVYKYNTLGKMIEVTQGVQQRFFLYDSLGRTLRVRQPEQQVNSALNLSNPDTTNTQWTGGFSYDNNGNVLTTTDAKNVTTTDIYDALNRVTTKSYSDATTPTVNYTYDEAAVPFSKGKLTKVGSTISETRYTAYDTMGRLAASEQRTPFGTETTTQATPRTSSYKYNLAGIMTEQTYPSGRVVKNILEPDGDLAAISSKVSNGQYKTYASNFAYTASGVIEHLQVGSGLWESAKMNSRNQVTELKLGTSPTDGSLWKLNYEYGEFDANGNVDATKNSGNIARQTVGFTGLAQPFVQIYKYDSLDRITQAKETSGTNQTWIQTFDYDRYGNRTQFSQNVLGQQMAVNNQTLPAIDANTNRIQTGQGYSYDANGNLIQDYAGRQFTFDGDNRQIIVKDASNNPIGRYYYDGSGKRVKKVTNSETVIFAYDGAGKLVAEYSTAAPVQNPTTNYTATDPLGSPRVVTNKQGQIVSRRDFLPFGEELAPDSNYRTANLKYGSNDTIRQKFTGYQRDEETQLDFAEARYYNNSHGRFTAVDPLLASGKSANPQTFNRYAYTMNRPLILTDSTGLQVGKKILSVKGETYKPVLGTTSARYEKTPDGPVITIKSAEVIEVGRENVVKTNDAVNKILSAYGTEIYSNEMTAGNATNAVNEAKGTATLKTITLGVTVNVDVTGETAGKTSVGGNASANFEVTNTDDIDAVRRNADGQLYESAKTQLENTLTPTTDSPDTPTNLSSEAIKGLLTSTAADAKQLAAESLEENRRSRAISDKAKELVKP